MNFVNILITELAFVTVVLLGLGFVKLPKFLTRKQLSRHFPWGYYPDQVPRGDPGFSPEHNTDFLHDVGAEFGGLDNLGDFGEFSGFGELGEFGSSFWGGGE
ncbi:MAG: hypothetical protein AB7W16_22950 [Candidatus Obscuribacterales bacterium]